MRPSAAPVSLFSLFSGTDVGRHIIHLLTPRGHTGRIGSGVESLISVDGVFVPSPKERERERERDECCGAWYGVHVVSHAPWAKQGGRGRTNRIFGSERKGAPRGSSAHRSVRTPQPRLKRARRGKRAKKEAI